MKWSILMYCYGLYGLAAVCKGDFPRAMSSEIWRVAGRYHGIYPSESKHDNLFLHENGLLYANGTEKAITWMNSTVNGHPVIPAYRIYCRGECFVV